MSKVLELKVSDAVKAYNKGTSNDKALLENLYGKEIFSQKITDRVKSFEDACEVLGIDPQNVFSLFDAKDDIAYKKLKVVALALNAGWTPNWDNTNEYKYYPYFKMLGGFSLDVVVGYCSGSFVGSRLCFRSRVLAEHAGTICSDLYKDYMVIHK